MIVYKATNIDNGKVYIGITTKTLEQRIKGHISEMKNRNRKRYFIRSLAIHEFRWEVLVDRDMSLGKLCALERKFIRIYDTMNPKKGYNLSTGGRTSIGYRHSEATKKILSEKAKGNTRCKGRKISDTHKKIISNKMKSYYSNNENRIKTSLRMKGKRASIETRSKMSKSHNSRYQNNDELKERISEKMKSVWLNPEYRKVITDNTRNSWSPERKKKHSEYMKNKWAERRGEHV